MKFKQLRCSFCGKKESEVLKLVAGPHVYICEACVLIATRLMNDPSPDDQSTTLEMSNWRRVVTWITDLIRRERSTTQLAGH